jgi:hypothetical protein
MDGLERIIGKYEWWSAIEIDDDIYIGGCKEVCRYQKKEGKIT